MVINSGSVPDRNFVLRRNKVQEELQEALDMINEGGVDYVEVVESPSDGQDGMESNSEVPQE